MRVALGMSRNATKVDSRLVSRKVPFPFSECQNRVFLKQLLKSKIERWEQHPTLIVDHLGYAYQLSFCCGSLWRYILNFVVVPADFAGSGVVLHFRGKK
jgi:hypothetical protein